MSGAQGLIQVSNSNTVAATATKILNANPLRRGFRIYADTKNALRVFFGEDTTFCTTSSLVFLCPGETMEDTEYKGPVYFIGEAANMVVRYEEY